MKPCFVKFRGFTAKRPFFQLFGDEKTVVESFISAVKNDQYEQASLLLSKYIRSGLDFPRIKNIVEKQHVRLAAVRFNELPRSIHPSSIYFPKGDILHVYTVFEPDRVSAWKICAIEKE